MIFLCILSTLSRFTYENDTPDIVASLALYPGTYHISCIGGSGGSSNYEGRSGRLGGYGAKAEGDLVLLKKTSFTIRIGGSGVSDTFGGMNGGFNGGGKSGKDWGVGSIKGNDGAGSGGGATDIRIGDSTNSRIMVASGGSGASALIPGAPGGLEKPLKIVDTAGTATESTDTCSNTGIGGDGEDTSNPLVGMGISGSGGGGGYCGGKGGEWSFSQSVLLIGQSGSSFISGFNGMSVIQSTRFQNAKWYRGNANFPHPSSGNGIVSISSSNVFENCMQIADIDTMKCQQCTNNKFLSIDQLECGDSCEIGTYQSKISGNFKCIKCGSGQYSDGTKDHCDSCPLGFYGDGTKDHCEKCENNTYTSEAGQDSCSVCDADGFGVNSLNTECNECPPGHFGKDGYCSQCPVGYYTNTSKQSRCFMCPKNTFSNGPGSDHCEECPKGTYSKEGWSTCATVSFRFTKGIPKLSLSQMLIRVVGLVGVT